MDPALGNVLRRVAIKTDGVAVLFPTNIRSDRGFQSMLAQLFEKRCAELRIVQRRCAETNQSVPMSTLEPGLIGLGHPKRQQAQYPPRLLETRQCLPFPLEHRHHRRVKRIRSRERVLGGVDVEPVRYLLPMLPNPSAISLTSRNSIPRQHNPAIRHQLTLVPFKKAAANDLGSF